MGHFAGLAKAAQVFHGWGRLGRQGIRRHALEQFGEQGMQRPAGSAVAQGSRGQGRPLDDVLQLADVPWPAML
ncbi:hypothetical protein D3C80_2046780 [compost metagenome]